MTFSAFSRTPRQPSRPARRSCLFRPSVEALEDRQVLSTFTVTNTNDTGAGSLRDAILAANATLGKDYIEFNIPGNFTTISVLSTLPDITDPVVINGYTQPGSKYNLSNTGENAIIPIQLFGGSGGSTATSGLRIFAPNCLVAGLRIDGFKGYGMILWPGADHTDLIGNFIGVGQGNGFDGILVYSSHNTIGGGAASDRNLISGNKGNGIFLGASPNNKPDSNLIQNNWIGRDAAGNALGNGQAGVLIQNGSFNQVGGGPGGLQGNDIAYNKQDGVVIDGNSSAFNSLASNHIHANGYNGVSLDSGAHDNTIGGTGQGNTIISNGYSGVSMDGGQGNFVSGDNAIYDNQVQGIKLANGANQNIAAPQLSSAVYGATATTITGTFHGKPNSGYEIRFYANDNLPHRADQGVKYLGAIGVTTDANGNATFTATFLGAQPLKTITATAGGFPEGTSQFSAPVLAVPAPQPPQPPQSPPGDVTAQVSVKRGKVRRRADGTYRQRVTLTNVGAGPVQAPLYLVLDRLTRKVRLKKRAGVTKSLAPVGSPYRLVDAGPSGVLQPGESRTTVLVFLNPLGRKVRYAPRVLTGAGAP
jgi:hypothetical protein